MSSFYSDASLVLIPSGYKNQKVYSAVPTDGSGDLSFTRASDATRVASNGLIEKVRTNNFVQSQALATSWLVFAASGAGTIVRTNNYAAAPDGTMTATRIQNTGTSTVQWVYQNLVSSPSVVSIYAKRTGATNQTFTLFGNNGNTQSATFTATDTWQRFTFALGSHISLPVGINADASGSAYDILFWGAQLEDGDVATDYIATTTAAVSVGPVSGLPRLDYLGSTCPRLLLEPQRTNVLQYSEQIDNAAWAKSLTTITANAVTSPSGYQDADKLVETASLGVHRAAPTSTTNLNGTYSFFAKSGERTKVAILSTTIDLGFDLSNGTLINLGSGTSVGKIENYGNGWYRCSLPQASGIVALSLALLDDAGNISYTGNGTSGAYFWGAQLEVGAYATSYIPTLGASVTRVADAASKTGISSLIGQTEGTMFIDTQVGDETDEVYGWLQASLSGNPNDSIQINRATTTVQCQVYIGSSVTGFISGGSITTGQRIKIAVGYKQNDVVLYLNGTQIGVDTSTNIPTCAVFQLGAYPPLLSDYTNNGGIKQALLFKTRLTNAQLAELTA
jgi:hypothetical protein